MKVYLKNVAQIHGLAQGEGNTHYETVQAQKGLEHTIM